MHGLIQGVQTTEARTFSLLFKLLFSCQDLFAELCILYFHVTSLPFYLCRWWSKANDKVNYYLVTLEVVYDHVGKCRKLALCYFLQINLILFCLTTICSYIIARSELHWWAVVQRNVRLQIEHIYAPTFRCGWALYGYTWVTNSVKHSPPLE